MAAGTPCVSASIVLIPIPKPNMMIVRQKTKMFVTIHSFFHLLSICIVHSQGCRGARNFPQVLEMGYLIIVWMDNFSTKKSLKLYGLHCSNLILWQWSEVGVLSVGGKKQVSYSLAEKCLLKFLQKSQAVVTKKRVQKDSTICTYKMLNF